MARASVQLASSRRSRSPPRAAGASALQQSHRTVVDWISPRRGRLGLEGPRIIPPARSWRSGRWSSCPRPQAPRGGGRGRRRRRGDSRRGGPDRRCRGSGPGRSEDLERALEGTTAEREETRGGPRGRPPASPSSTASWRTRRVLDEMRAQAEEERGSARAGPSRRHASWPSGSSASSAGPRRRRSI